MNTVLFHALQKRECSLEEICDPHEIVQNIKHSLQQPNIDLKQPDNISLGDSGHDLLQRECDNAGRDIKKCNNRNSLDLSDIKPTGRD